MRKGLRYASDNQPLKKNLLFLVSPEKAFSSSQLSASKQSIPSKISGFRPEVDKNCALLDYFAASSTDISGQIIDHIFKGQESYDLIRDP
jgi:hypothetical protein